MVFYFYFFIILPVDSLEPEIQVEPTPEPVQTPEQSGKSIISVAFMSY